MVVSSVCRCVPSAHSGAWHIVGAWRVPPEWQMLLGAALCLYLQWRWCQPQVYGDKMSIYQGTLSVCMSSAPAELHTCVFCPLSLALPWALPDQPGPGPQEAF